MMDEKMEWIDGTTWMTKWDAWIHQMDGWMNEWIHQMDGLMNGWVDRWMGWMDLTNLFSLAQQVVFHHSLQLFHLLLRNSLLHQLLQRF